VSVTSGYLLRVIPFRVVCSAVLNVDGFPKGVICGEGQLAGGEEAGREELTRVKHLSRGVELVGKVVGLTEPLTLPASGVYPNISIDHVIPLLVVIEEEDGVENEEGE